MKDNRRVILIVDHPDINMGMSALLQRSGLIVLTADDIAAASKVYAANKHLISLIIIDDLGGKSALSSRPIEPDGLKFILDISDDGTLKSQVIFTTGAADDYTWKLLHNISQNPVLQKPFVNAQNWLAKDILKILTKPM